MTVDHLFSILSHRRKVALSIFGAVVALAIALTFLMTPKYTATSSVVVDVKSDPLSATGFSEQLLTGYVETQVAVIGSERVAERVVKIVHLDEIPKLQNAWRSKTHGVGDFTAWIAQYLLDGRVAVGTGKAKVGNVITISVKWPDAKTAAAIANAFAQAAIETNIELKVEPARQFAAWFNVHSQELRAVLQARQKKLSDYESQMGIVATDEKLDVENARLTELSTQLVAIQAERQQSQSKLRQVGADNESVEEVLNSQVVAKLKSDLSDAEAKQADIASTLGKNHPDYQAAAAEVANLRSRIQQEVTRITNGLGSNAQIDARRENDIRQALEAQKKKVLEMKHQHDEAAVLESDVAAAQRDLDAVSERYAQTNLESQARQTTNMAQLTVASVPIDPSSPKLVLNILVGILFGSAFGIAGAVFAERKDPRARDDEEIAALLGVPTLAKINKAKTKKPKSPNGPPVPLELPAT